MIRRLGLSRRLLRHVAPGDAIYRRSLASDVLSAGALGAVGDVICQVGAEGVAWKDIDRRRVAALTVFSSVYIGACRRWLASCPARRHHPPARTRTHTRRGDQACSATTCTSCTR
jgi:hypothetical protein